MNRADLTEKLGLLVDDALLEIDHNMIITEANAAGIRLLGDFLTGSSLDQKIDSAGFSEEFITCIKTSKVVDFTATPKINHYRHIRGRMMAWGDDRVIVLLMDMTLQHNLEKMRRDFIANVSHELRSPLTSLIGFIETMQNTSELDQSMNDRFLKIMDEEAKRMSRLIDDLMSLSKVEVDEHIIPEGKVFIKSMLNATINTLSNRALKTGHDIRFRDHRIDQTDDPIIRGENDEIMEVFHNLLDNALKYSFPASPIHVDMRDNASGQLVINITNQGEGIEEKHIPRLTERFYRVDKGRSRQLGGTGLGLAIVKHIVSKHRGQLTIHSEPKKETVFSVVLPYFTKSE
ncbi:MAG: ATP-binding protein [Candidatus Puniceispirillales bacterium]